MTEVKINPFSEIIAKKLSGIGGVPAIAQQRMIGNAIDEATKYHDQRIADLEAQLADARRHKELLRAVAAAGKTFVTDTMYTYSVDFKADFERAYQAAIDGGALEDGEE